MVVVVVVVVVVFSLVSELRLEVSLVRVSLFSFSTFSGLTSGSFGGSLVFSFCLFCSILLICLPTELPSAILGSPLRCSPVLIGRCI